MESLSMIKKRYKLRGEKKYKIFYPSLIKIFCLHRMIEQSEWCMDASASYQCKKCGLIITDDLYSDSYYKQKVSEF